MTSLTILGVMSGSSLDGLDLAIVRFSISGEVESWRLLHATTVPLARSWQERLRDLPHADVKVLARCDADFGAFIGATCKQYVERSGIAVDYIASHGHTVVHAPHDGYSLQIGCGAHIAAASGCPAITGFRSADIAHGGQGAPLAPVAEKYLFQGYPFYLNIGGIANLSFYDGTHFRAWDVCPANQLLNHCARKAGLPFDEDGNMAAKGKVLPSLGKRLSGLTKLPIHQPSSLDNSDIRKGYLPIVDSENADPADLLATVCAFIVRSIAIQAAAQQYTRPAHMLITGGGAHNGHLVHLLQQHLQEHDIHIDLPSPGIIDFKEAILMALCGALRVAGLPNALASVTGASRDTVNGVVHSA